MLHPILFYLDIIAPLLVLSLAVLFFYFSKQKIIYGDYIILLFLLWQAILNTAAPILQSRQINNHFLYHFNCLVTATIFTAYFYFSLKNKKFVLGGFLFFFIFWLINILFIQPYQEFNSYSYALAALLIVDFSLLNFYQLITHLPASNILRLKDFWILTGLLTYFGSSFFIFITYNYLSEIDPQNVGILWRTHNVFFFASSFIFLKALTCK